MIQQNSELHTFNLPNLLFFDKIKSLQKMLILLKISGHTKVKYFINCPGISDYPRSELENLRRMLATLIHANYDDIVVSGVKTGCVIVTMMIRNCLIPSLKALYTSEKLTLTCHWMLKLSLKYKIMKVVIKDDVLYPPGRSWVIINLPSSNTSSVNATLYCFFPNSLLTIFINAVDSQIHCITFSFH